MLDKLINQLPITINDNYFIDYITKNQKQDLYEMYSNEKVAKYVASKTYSSMEDVEEFMETIELRMQQGNNVYVGIYCSGSKKLVGIIRFLVKEEVEVLTLGYALNETYWGRGIVPLALNKLIHIIEEEGRFSILRATIRPENNASRRCIEKLGFELSGSFKKQKVFGEQEGEADAERLLYLKKLSV